MAYTAQFKSLRGETYTVEIAGGGSGELTLSGDDPVTIEYEHDDIFKPLKMSACSVKVLTTAPLLSLYTGTLNGVTCSVKRGSDLIWFGFLTPNVYSSGYRNVWDEMTLEFVDPLSAMENVKFRRFGDKLFGKFSDYISQALEKVGAEDVEVEGMPTELTDVGCMQKNFVDEVFDESDDAMTWQEVMENIALYMNKTMVMVGKTLKIYDPLSSGESSLAIKDVGVADSNGSISMNGIYNRLTVVESTNPIESILDSELLDDDNMESVMWESIDSEYYDDDVKAYRVPVTYNKKNYIDYRAVYRPKSASGWQMYGSGLIMAVADSETKQFAKDSVLNGWNQPIEKGCFALYDCNYTSDNVPSKLSFQKKVMMFCNRALLFGDSTWCGTRVFTIPGMQTTPFIKYTKTGTDIVMKGGYLILALKYKYLELPMTSLELDQKTHGEVKVSKFLDYFNSYCGEGDEKLDEYGRDTFRCKLQVGNKYFNGTQWTETASTFDIVHTWEGGDNMFFNDVQLDNTATYKLRLNEEVTGFAIPVLDAELFGDIKFELCPPSYMGKNYLHREHETDEAGNESWIEVIGNPAACCVISELKLVYSTQVNSTEGLVLDNDSKNRDIKHTGYGDSTCIMDMDDIEMKVNTWSALENSYSYAIKKTGENLSYYIPATLPEKQCIKRNVEYYGTARLRYSNTLNNKAGKRLSPMSNIVIAGLGTFTMGTVKFNLADDSADVTLLQL